MESGIQQIFATNMKSWPLEPGIKIKKSGSPQTNEIQNPSSTEKEYGILQIFAVKYGILAFGIGNTDQGIRDPTNEWNPESSTCNPGTTVWIQNPTLSWIPETTFINHLETDTGRKVMLHETIRNDHDDF